VSIPREDARRQLEQVIQTRSARCVVVGLGFIGSTVMDALLAAGFEVHGYDRDPAVAARYRERGPGGPVRRAWSAGDDPAVLRDARVVVVAVRALVRSDASIDLDPLRSVAAALRAEAAEPRLILVKCTLPPGTTRAFSEQLLGLDRSSSTFVAHSPDRLKVGDDWETLGRMPHLVGGLDAAASDLAGQLLQTICERAVRVSSPEVSELSKLLENAFLSVGIAVVGEVTRIAHALGISAREVCEAAATKTSGYFPFQPGPGVGGHCLPNDLKLLNAVSRSYGGDSPLVSAASEVLDLQPRLCVDQLERRLEEQGLHLSGSPVLLVGVGFKPGSPDTTMTPAQGVVRRIRERGGRPSYLDSQVPQFEVDGVPVTRIESEWLEPHAFVAGIVLAGDAGVDPERLSSAVRVLLDAGGGRVMRGPLRGAHTL